RTRHSAGLAARGRSRAWTAVTRRLPEAHAEKAGPAGSQDNGGQDAFALELRPEADEGGHAVDGRVVDLGEDVTRAQAGFGEQAVLGHAGQGEAGHAPGIDGGNE